MSQIGQVGLRCGVQACFVLLVVLSTVIKSAYLTLALALNAHADFVVAVAQNNVLVS